MTNKDKEIRWGELRRNCGRGKTKSLKRGNASILLKNVFFPVPTYYQIFSLPDFTEINVKVFIGIEYECPRGHRFICSAPEKVLKASGSGLIKVSISLFSKSFGLFSPAI